MNKGHFPRDDRNYQLGRKDAYLNAGKHTEPTVCTGCGAVFHGGRWTWNETLPEARHALCPACQRTADNFPAGFVEISGDYFRENRDELISLIRHEEESEKKNRPLERIIAVRDVNHHTLVTTTGIHVARRIGESLARAHQGELSFHYGDGEKSIRVYWKR